MPAWLLPAAMMGAQALFGGISAKKKADQQRRMALQEQTRGEDDRLRKNQMLVHLAKSYNLEHLFPAGYFDSLVQPRRIQLENDGPNWMDILGGVLGGGSAGYFMGADAGSPKPKAPPKLTLV